MEGPGEDHRLLVNFLSIQFPLFIALGHQQRKEYLLGLGNDFRVPGD
jgi:hypothetical protein